MIYRQSRSLRDPRRERRANAGVARQLVDADDGFGVSLHEETLEAGTSLDLCFEERARIVYCVAGRGDVINLETGEFFELRPGAVYAVDEGSRHMIETKSRMRLLSVFTPGLAPRAPKADKPPREFREATTDPTAVM